VLAYYHARGDYAKRNGEGWWLKRALSHGANIVRELRRFAPAAFSLWETASYRPFPLKSLMGHFAPIHHRPFAVIGLRPLRQARKYPGSHREGLSFSPVQVEEPGQRIG